MVNNNIARIRDRISLACGRCGRDASSVTLIAVTKYRPVEDLLPVLETGILDIGENKVQEALLKFDAIRNTPYAQRVKLHMIGHLQTNKAKDAVRVFDLIHSVDSRRIALEIDKEAAKINKVQDILIEVKTSEEETKYGVIPEDLAGLVEFVSGLAHIRLKGFMTMAPAAAPAQSAGLYFAKLKKLSDIVNASRGPGQALAELSMGMSDDFEEAIVQGSTMVRVGRAIFEG